MKLGRILYLIPPNTDPCGGILTRYQHCYFLQKLGFNANLLHRKNHKITWFEHSLKPITIDETGYDLNNNDVVVACEVFPYEALVFKNAIKIMFVQGWSNVFREFSKTSWYNILGKSIIPEAGLRKIDHKKSYIDLGYDYVITNSAYNTNYLRDHMKVEAETITNRIELKKFIYKPYKKERNSILALTRKNKQDLLNIRQKVDLEVSSQNLKWIYADQLSQDELIKKYQKADIFLATGYPEGSPRPPLEAMACGCSVVGFTGGGGLEYMIDGETALVAKDGDCETASKKLLELLNHERFKEKIRINGISKSREYTLENFKPDLKKFYSKIEEEMVGEGFRI